jgi:hypothetical protein
MYRSNVPNRPVFHKGKPSPSANDRIELAKGMIMTRIAFWFFFGTGILCSQTNYLNVWSNGKPTSIAVQDIEKLTLTDNLNVWTNGQVTSFPIQDIQKLTFSTASGVEEKEEATTVLKAFKLLRNYPNPFNPSTTIEYEIPAGGDVSIRIFSMNGQLVRSFNKAHPASGSYTVTWDGKTDVGQTVSSGSYIFRASYGNSTVANKMMFVK